MDDNKREYLLYILDVIGSDVRAKDVRDGVYNGKNYDVDRVHNVFSETYTNLMTFHQFIRDFKLEKLLS